jgi:endoglucanase
LLTGRALDNRIGGFIIAMALKKLYKSRKKLKVNVVALNAVQEEIGGYGARMMTHRLRPDVAIVTDVTHATDTPGINQKEHGAVKLGGGPTVTHGAASHPLLVRHIEDVAEKKKLLLQHVAASVRTGTDTDSIYHVRDGVPSALISLPLRYMHSPVEMASMSDVEALVDLMAESVLALDGKSRFHVLD